MQSIHLAQREGKKKKRPGKLKLDYIKTILNIYIKKSEMITNYSQTLPLLHPTPDVSNANTHARN